MMYENIPSFQLTNQILNLVAAISVRVGQITILSREKLSPHLRKVNRVKTIHSSLAIEQNSLSLEEVTAVLNGKRILGRPSEIQEVRNASEAYDLLLTLEPLSIPDLLRAHQLMMKHLISENGSFRRGSVGVVNGTQVIHIAPPAHFVSDEIQELMNWYRDSDVHPLIKSAVFHYDFEFIHPFADGNGRIGRMWHSLLLGQWNEIFYWLPVEELIQNRQEEYYIAFRRANATGNCTEFIEFMLQVISDTLRDVDEVGLRPAEAEKKEDTPVQRLLDALGEETLSASELMSCLGLSHRPSFRKNYLLPALQKGLIEMTIPDKPNSRNQRYRKRS